MKKTSITLTIILISIIVYGQTTLINPATNGGFESGTTYPLNGWTLVNHATNIWTLGNTPGGQSGARCAYITNAAPAWTYTTTTSQTSHFYRSVTFPAGETEISLSFKWKCQGESGYDRLLVYTCTAAPASGTPASSTTAWGTATLVGGPYNSNTTWQTATVSLPAALAGTTTNLIFTWQNDGSLGSSPPVAVDDISLVSSSPYLMSNTPVTTCSGKFVDDGGEAGNYTSADYTKTFTPGTAGMNLQFVFTTWTMGDAEDFLSIYDGPTTGSPLIGTFNNTTGSPGTVTATNGTGQLTFQWTSDNNGLGAGWVATIACVSPPPANDNCSGATTLTVNPNLACGTVTAGTVLSATPSSDANDCGATIDDDDVWYKFVATATTHYISLLNVAGSVTDMYHSVFTGTCGSLGAALLCSDPNNSIVSGLTIGNTYYVRVYTYSSTGGQTTTFDICVGTPPPPPANDDCANAVMLTVNPTLTCTATTSGTVASATASPDANGCFGDSDDDVWYKFVATHASHVITLSNIAGSTTDMYFSVHSGACGSLTELLCSDANSNTVTGLTPGNTYYVRVFTYTSTGGQTSTFDVCVATEPMAYVSCTVTQPNTTGVPINSTNKEIIRMEIVVTGISSPLSATAFRVQTTGTTSVSDIQNMRIWYTGNSTTFATTTQFGATVAAPSGSMTVAGSQTLTTGTNYFWLSYDIVPGATAGNVVDAECDRITVGSNRTPTTTAPFGSRPITPPPPVNDEPCGATILAVNNGSCSFQTANLEVSTTASSGIPAPGCSSLGVDIWFQAVVPASGRLIVDLSQSGGPTDMGMAWYYSSTNNCNNIDNLIECDDDDSQDGAMPMICRSGVMCTVPGDCAQNATLTPGMTVYIRIWEYGGGTFGQFDICAYEPSSPGAPSTCATAQVIAALPFTASGQSTCCRINDYNSGDGCGSLYQDGEDFLYSYTPSTNQTIDITTTGTLSYTGLFITDKCPTAGGVNCIASAESSSGNPSLCGVSLNSGTTYYIMIDTDGSPMCTPFNISIMPSTAPTCNMAYTVATTTYSWDTYMGTNIVLPIDDRFCNIYIPVGFPTCFDGYQFSGLLVSSNGYLIYDPISCSTNLPTTNAAPNTYSPWSITAAIPNVDNAPRNAILGPWHDIDPAEGGVITYGILGTAPNRRFVVTWADAPLFSSSCGQLITQQIKIFETTNNIEIHIKDKEFCTAWNNGAAIMGLHNYNGTQAVVPAGGYNYPTTWEAHNEAWKFTYACPTCIVPLPVELTSFKGKNEGPVNKLWWSTSSETNNEYFVIEKFTNGEFQEIGRINGSGNSNTVKYYEFYDDLALQINSYYKLKQVDFNGKFKYSDIISVSKPISFEQTVYPNPAIDVVNISLANDVSTVQAIVSNNFGQKIISHIIDVNNSVFQLNVSDLENGVYTLHVIDLTGNTILKDKVIINRK